MLLILNETFSHLKDQATTVEAYDSLSKQINMSFKRVFDRLIKLKSNPLFALEAESYHARGGEQHMREQQRQQHTVQWRSISEFFLQDEDSKRRIYGIRYFRS
ncbi:unnamed protein product [Lactuca virosa]|uniref:Uncharacterized protein n=1 Tax=Lactuca virosa TaxID=75947 RepID=A0AAU9N2Q5_9ASTR|nr:unnamed protein product [Lactuca virosa]